MKYASSKLDVLKRLFIINTCLLLVHFIIKLIFYYSILIKNFEDNKNHLNIKLYFDKLYNLYHVKYKYANIDSILSIVSYMHFYKF